MSKKLVEGAACEADALYKATDIYNVIKSAPTADVVEVRHGKWIEDEYYDIPCVCSCCGAEAQYTSTFEETFDYDSEEFEVIGNTYDNPELLGGKG